MELSDDGDDPNFRQGDITRSNISISISSHALANPRIMSDASKNSGLPHGEYQRTHRNMDGNEIKEIWDDLKRNAELLYKKKTLTPSDLQEIQSYVIISIYIVKY